MALFTLKGLNRRRWELFKANRRGFWSLWIFGALFLMSVFAPIIANDRPMLVSYKGELLFPTFVRLSRNPSSAGSWRETDYRDPVNQDEINANGWMIWPPIRYSYNTVNNELPRPAPSTPAFKSHAGGGLRQVSARCCRPQLQFRQFELAGNR